jgi:hypothetical protein
MVRLAGSLTEVEAAALMKTVESRFPTYTGVKLGIQSRTT